MVPPELGSLRNLEELLLYHNQITTLPYEIGRLFQCGVLGLQGNPLVEPLASYLQEGTDAVLSYLLDNAPSRKRVCSPCPGRTGCYLTPHIPPQKKKKSAVVSKPPEREWIAPSKPTMQKIPPGCREYRPAALCCPL